MKTREIVLLGRPVRTSYSPPPPAAGTKHADRPPILNALKIGADLQPVVAIQPLQPFADGFPPARGAVEDQRILGVSSFGHPAPYLALCTIYGAAMSTTKAFERAMNKPATNRFPTSRV